MGRKARATYSAYLGISIGANAFHAMRLSLARTDCEGYLDGLYHKVLKREPDPSGMRHFLDMATGRRPSLGWRYRVFSLFCKSPEFLDEVIRRSGTKDPMHAHHEARKMWVAKHIPPAKNVLDLGGSCSYDIDGALLAMGYPHQPEAVTIIDFPPQDRVSSSFSTLTEANHTAKSGARIRFIYDSFVNLKPFADATFDLVVAGQVIEHVTQEDGDRVLREAYRILKPGGHLCLDTPNRRITRLITSGFIHPEHKLEYECGQLRDMAKRAGFRVLEEGAISPLPDSCRRQRFISRELSRNMALGPQADVGFSFFLTLQKEG